MSNPSSVDALLQDGWGYHDSDSERLAGELEQLNLRELNRDQAAAVLKLANHTLGEHLQDWRRSCSIARQIWQLWREQAPPMQLGIQYAVAEALGGDSIAAAKATLLATQYAVAQGEPAAAAALSVTLEFQLAIASALIGSKRIDEGLEFYVGVVELAQQLDENSATNRSLAIASNNIAGELLDLPTRSSVQDHLMQGCAGNALTFWRRCGTWENEERALYLLQLVRFAQADYRGAIDFAHQAMQVIQANGAEPVDEGFILLTMSAAHWHLEEPAEAQAALASADALVADWHDKSLQTYYQVEKEKLLGKTGMLNAAP